MQTTLGISCGILQTTPKTTILANTETRLLQHIQQFDSSYIDAELSALFNCIVVTLKHPLEPVAGRLESSLPSNKHTLWALWPTLVALSQGLASGFASCILV